MWKLCAVTMAGLVLAAFAGCNRTDNKQHFVMVPKGVNPYYDPCYEGFKDAGAKFGIETEFRAPQDFSVSEQQEVIEDLIQKHVDGIAISANDDQGLVGVIDEATKAGIKVITFDAPAPSSKALCYIGTVNDAAGYTAGTEMAKRMGDKGVLLMLQGGMGSQNLNERYAGFERAMKEKAPHVTIIAREDTQGKIPVAQEKTEQLLQAHPDATAIFGLSGECIPGAVPALKSANKAGKILLGGFDDIPDTLAAIRDGTCQFCLAQKTYKMGWLSVVELQAACAGKELPKQIDTGVLLVTKDNVDTYMAHMKEEAQQWGGEAATMPATMGAGTAPATQK
ncbi:MAG TPA: sugar-binding protein [Phycisphaerae bacterium]|nr:sugar-binding protein [Phycisphaerae bacterium]